MLSALGSAVMPFSSKNLSNFFAFFSRLSALHFLDEAAKCFRGHLFAFYRAFQNLAVGPAQDLAHEFGGGVGAAGEEESGRR